LPEATTAAPAANLPPVVNITSPGAFSGFSYNYSTNTETDGRIQTLTPVTATIDDPNGDLASWSLVLRPIDLASGVTAADIPLASGTSPVGTQRNSDGTLVNPNGDVVATLDPTQYPNGNYDLILTGTDAGGRVSTSVVEVSLYSAAKLGNFTLPVNDLTFNVPGGQPITVNITLPGGGQHAFEFLPIPTNYDAGEQPSPYGASTGYTDYYIQFVCVDGSGATLSVPGDIHSPVNDRADLTYDAHDNEFFDANGDPYFPTLTNLGDVSGGNQYTVKTTDGSVYNLNATTGKLTSSVDPDGNTTTYSAGGITENGYQLKIVRDGPANTISSIYLADASGDMIGNPITYSYDSTTDNLTSVTDRLGQTTQYVYDTAPSMSHYLTQVIGPNNIPTLTATYNAQNQLATLAGPTGAPADTGVSSDGSSGSQTVTDLDGNVTENIYDAEGDVARSIQTLKDSSGNITGYLVTAHDYTYGSPDVLDAIVNGTTQPSDITTVYSYNDLNQLTDELATNTATDEPVFSDQYDLNADGTRQDVIETQYNGDGSVFAKTQTNWSYDADGRMTDEQLVILNDGTGGTSDANGHAPAAYDDVVKFDLANNRVEEDTTGGTDGAGVIDYTYNSDDQLLTEDRTGSNAYAITYGHTTSGVFIKGYDAWGNQTEQHRTGTNPEDDVYTWDLQGNMTSAAVTVSGTTATTDYAYDSNGVRTSETTNAGTSTAATTFYLNDPNNPTGYTKAVEEKQGATAATATVSRSYVLGLKVEGQSDSTNGKVYYLTDGHGSTRALVNTSGAVIERYDYDAFGTMLLGQQIDPTTQAVTNITAATAATPWLFGGDGLYDPSTGWTYQLARWRDGFRFTSSDTFAGDPSSPISLHRYLYADVDPANAG
jgi:hypothetical protein